MEITPPPLPSLHQKAVRPLEQASPSQNQNKLYGIEVICLKFYSLRSIHKSTVNTRFFFHRILRIPTEYG